MFLKLFKSNQPTMVIVLPVIAAILWFLPTMFHSENIVRSYSNMPISEIFSKLVTYGSLSSKILGYVFMVSTALLISRLNTKFIFISERTYLPTFIYIVLVCGITSERNMLASSPALILFLFAFERILDSYKTESLSYNIFDASLLLGIASLFYFNTIFLIVFIWAALIVLRPFFLREWLFTLIGLVLPYFITASIYYLTDIPVQHILDNIADSFQQLEYLVYTNVQIAYIGYIAILIIIASQFMFTYSAGKKIIARRSFSLFFFLFIVSATLYFLLKPVTTEIVMLAAFPVSMLLSDYFISARRTRVVSILFNILLALVVVALFINW